MNVISVWSPSRDESAAVAMRLAADGRNLVIPQMHSEQVEAAMSWVGMRGQGGSEEAFILSLPQTMEPGVLLRGVAEGDQTLAGCVCVLRADRLLAELNDTIFDEAAEQFGGQFGIQLVARALVQVTHIETAHLVILTGWEQLPTEEISLLRALVSALTPSAVVHLDDGRQDLSGLIHPDGPCERTQPGWVDILNGEFRPRYTDPHLSAVSYESIRPFHPERLHDVLSEVIEPGLCGAVISSAGFAQLATRGGCTALWAHVGGTIDFMPLKTEAQRSADGPSLGVGQQLAFIGFELDAEKLREALDFAVLTDEELIAGVKSWDEFNDPFPAWV